MWSSNATAITALRSRMGIDSGHFPDTDATAALNAGLDEITSCLPRVATLTFPDQSGRRIDLSSLYSWDTTATGSIGSFADYGTTVTGTVLATCTAAHGLTTNDRVAISASAGADYDGTYYVTVVDTTTFYITATWDVTATATWTQVAPESPILRVLGFETPLDSEPRQFRRWMQEEEFYFRLGGAELSSDDVRLWYTTAWSTTTIPNEWNELCLIAAIAVGLSGTQNEAMIYWSLGQDAAWAGEMMAMVRNAQEEWERRVPDLKGAGAVRLQRWMSNYGRFS